MINNIFYITLLTTTLSCSASAPMEVDEHRKAGSKRYADSDDTHTPQPAPQERFINNLAKHFTQLMKNPNPITSKQLFTDCTQAISAFEQHAGENSPQALTYARLRLMQKTIQPFISKS